MIGRPVVLLRCSTDRQDVDFATQRADVSAWLAGAGLVVAPEDWREEVAMSGASRVRPVLDRILDEAERGELSHVICADFDRAGRSGARTVAMVEDLAEDYGVAVVFARERWIIERPISFDSRVLLLAKSIGGLAKLEAVSSSTRGAYVKNAAGVTVSRRNGKRVGQPPLEWTPAGDAEILRLRAEGLSVENVAARKTVRAIRRRGFDEDGRLAWETEKPVVRFDVVEVTPGATAIRQRLRAIS